jgi:hypothetical protein
MGNPVISENFIRLLDTRLREVSENAWAELPSQKGELYRDVPSDSAWEEFFGIAGVADIPAFNGKLEYLSQSPGYLTRIEPKEYAAGQVWERTKAKIEVDPFAYAFSSAFTFMYSEEGVSLCSDSHTNKTGVSTAAGFDNCSTAAMSKTSVAAMRLKMLRFRNDIGERIVTDPDTIICGESLADTAFEIFKSEKSPDNANNTMNPLYNRFKVLVLKRLDDYDTNNFFLVDSRQMKKHLLWIDRIAKDSKMTIDFDTFMVKWSIYFRLGNGFKDWRWIDGANVS